MTYREIKSAITVAEEDVQLLQKTVKSILSKVKTDGDSAVRYYEKKFDDFDPPSFRISEEEAAKASEELPVEVIEELDFAIEQVTAFARAQRDSMVEFEKEIRPGMLMGQRII
ncbi:MAG: histidinol dehydrogenase, partial [Desulfobacterales bacterium]